MRQETYNNIALALVLVVVALVLAALTSGVVFLWRAVL